MTLSFNRLTLPSGISWNDYFWPDVDSDNLLEMLHRIMKHAPIHYTGRLVDEFAQLAEDVRADRNYLTGLFNREISAKHKVINKDNAREMILSLAEFLCYLSAGGLAPGAS